MNDWLFFFWTQTNFSLKQTTKLGVGNKTSTIHNASFDKKSATTFFFLGIQEKEIKTSEEQQMLWMSEEFHRLQLEALLGLWHWSRVKNPIGDVEISNVMLFAEEQRLSNG